MKLPATLSIVLLAAATLRAEAPSIQGTLPEDYVPSLKPLLVTAIERSPNTIAASISVAQQEAGKISAYAALYPSAGVSANYLKSRETTSNSLPSKESGLFYSASVNQPIFQWGALKNAA